MPARKAGRERMERQVAALPLRLSASGRLEALLITSRETGRWIIPKGNPMKGLKKPAVAAIEALEEAGIVGTIERGIDRSFTYWKRRSDGFVLCRVDVYLMLATRFEPSWKEAGQRRRVWAPSFVAAQLVLEPGLQSLLAGLSNDGDLHMRLRAHASLLAPDALDLPDDAMESAAIRRVVPSGPWRFSA